MKRKSRIAMFLAVLMGIASLFLTQPASALNGGSFLSLAYDGTLHNYGDDYGLVQANTSTDNVVVEYTSTTLMVGQDVNTGVYDVWRSAFFFDTTAIPVGVSIASAYVTMHGRENHSTTDFNLCLVSPGDLHSPLEVIDYATMLPKVTSLNNTFSTSGYDLTMQLELNGAGINSIIHAGVTVLGLRSSRDISASTPSGDEYVELYSSESAYPPTLTVVYYNTGVLGEPTTLTLSSAAVFNNYRQAGDQLWVCRADVKYSSGAEDLQSRDYWMLQILDDNATVKAAVPLWSWGYVPASIYLSAANALAWDNYTMQLIGSDVKYESPVPFVSHAMVPAEYKGSDNVALDEWCMATAIDIGRIEHSDVNYYRCPVSYYDSTKASYPWKINDAGQILFAGGIPLIDTVRANLFANAGIEGSPDTHGTSWSDLLWGHWGTSLTADWALIANVAGVPGQVAASGAFMVFVFVIVYVVTRETGKPILGMIPGVLGIILGTLLGSPNIVVLLSILALALIYVLYELIPAKT